MIRIERLGNLMDFDPSPSMMMGNGQKPPDIMRAGDDCPHCRIGLLRFLGRSEKRKYARRQNLKIVPKDVLYCDSCARGNRN